MDWMTFGGLVVRHAVGALGGYLVGKGLIDEATVTELIGAAGVLFAAGWSVVQKMRAAK